MIAIGLPPAYQTFLIAKLAGANADAIHFIKTDKEATEAIFSNFLKLNDPEGLERAAKLMRQFSDKYTTDQRKG